MLMKSWREGIVADQLRHIHKGSFSVILATSTEVKVAEMDNGIHFSRLKLVPCELSREQDANSAKGESYACEPQQDLRFLFKMKGSSAAKNK